MFLEQNEFETLFFELKVTRSLSIMTAAYLKKNDNKDTM
jgi:hypothetical protein